MRRAPIVPFSRIDVVTYKTVGSRHWNIRGLVLGTTEELIPNAFVATIEIATAARHVANVDSNGRYTFSNVPIGLIVPVLRLVDLRDISSSAHPQCGQQRWYRCLDDDMCRRLRILRKIPM